MITLDTDHLSELERRDSKRGEKLRERLDQSQDRRIAATVVSAEEQFRGRLAVINEKAAGTEQVLPYTRLIEVINFYASWLILPFDQAAAQQFHDLKARRIHIGTMDLKIAAIVLARCATLLSANLRDFRQVSGLSVEDWLS
jgi:tRNA(fMet)-specific endonuclease VapC